MGGAQKPKDDDDDDNGPGKGFMGAQLVPGVEQCVF